MAEPSGRRVVVVDGSNLATEGRTVPSLNQLDEAVRAYAQEDPDAEIVVVVDASFEHRINPSERPQLVQAELNGEVVSPPAGAIGRGDAFVLRIAERTGATVLSNDSFQEFHGEHPWLFEPGRLVGGKPVPGIGWIFTARNPVRGPKSRAVTGKTKRSGPGATLSPPVKAAELARAAKKLAARRLPTVLPDGSAPKVGDVWPGQGANGQAAGPAGPRVGLAAGSHNGADGAAVSEKKDKRKRSKKGDGQGPGPSDPDGAVAGAGAGPSVETEVAGGVTAAGAGASPGRRAGPAAPAKKAAAKKAAVVKEAAAAQKAAPVKKAAPAKKDAAAKKARPTPRAAAKKVTPGQADADGTAKKAGPAKKSVANAASGTAPAKSVSTAASKAARKAAAQAPATAPGETVTAATSVKKVASSRAAAATKKTTAVATAPRAATAKKVTSARKTAPSTGAAAPPAPTSPATSRRGRQAAARVPEPGTSAGAAPTLSSLASVRQDPALKLAIDQAMAELLVPPTDEETGSSKKEKSDGKQSKRRRRRSGNPPPAVNEPLAFITFVASYPLLSELEGEVVSFTSHGAMVDVELPSGGLLHCYIPLTAMGDPPPTKAREMLSRGERRRFVLVGLDPPRRVAELALAGGPTVVSG